MHQKAIDYHNPVQPQAMTARKETHPPTTLSSSNPPITPSSSNNSARITQVVRASDDIFVVEQSTSTSAFSCLRKKNTTKSLSLQKKIPRSMDREHISPSPFSVCLLRWSKVRILIWAISFWGVYKGGFCEKVG